MSKRQSYTAFFVVTKALDGRLTAEQVPAPARSFPTIPVGKKYTDSTNREPRARPTWAPAQRAVLYGIND